MNQSGTLGCLKAKWQELLERRSHYIYRKEIHPNVIRSRNGSKERYRWLLRVEDSPTQHLSHTELSEVRQHLRQAKKHREAAYLVIGFTHVPKRIVAIPANEAIKAGYVSSDKGGITWDD
jgi:hypothetical protein